MNLPGGETLVFEQSLRQRKPKSREVSSRYLSPTTPIPPLEDVVNSPVNTPSPLKQRAGRYSTDTRKHKILANSGFMRGLWPSSSTTTTTTTTQKSSNSKHGTLADCLGNERLMDLAHRKNPEKKHEKPEKSMNPTSLNRQRSCTEFNRFENDEKIAKENHKPLFGASMRYKGKFKFPGRSSSSSSTSPNLSDNNIVPGRLSVDERALRRRSLERKSDYLSDIVVDSESEKSDAYSGTSFGSPVAGKSLPASYMAPTVSSRMSGIEVSSKYMQDSSTRTRRWNADSGTAAQKPNSSDNSPKSFTLKSAMKRSNSFKITGIDVSKLGGSPVRSSSPTLSEENKGKGMSKPPTSPSSSRVKGVGNLLTIGLELLKGKKSYPTVSSPLGLGIGDSVHQMKLFHNRLLQWRYANAREVSVNGNITKQAERNLVYAWDALTKLRNSVRQKKLQLEKEKLEMKLNYILQSQIKSLEAWGAMERQHQSAITVTKDSLQSVVCKVPLVEGAKGEPQSVSMALRTALDTIDTIKLMHSKHLPMAHKTAATSRELAEIVTQEKLLLEECLEHFKIVSALEVQEASLKCNVMQLKLQSEQHHQHQANQEIYS